MTKTRPILHKDGTVTYWSVHQQAWVRHAAKLPDRELAAMGQHDRNRTVSHFAHHWKATPAQLKALSILE